MRTKARLLASDESGATMVEYGLLIALIALVAMVGIGQFGLNVRTLLFDLAISAFP